MENRIDLIQKILLDTPVGALLISATETALVRVRFLRDQIPDKLPAVRPHGVLDLAEEQLMAYFAGQLQNFYIPLDPLGTAFQKSVWAELRRIPYGETRSYGDIARALGKPGAARAVGMANNKNPLPIIIPCHRVIGADGKLVGFGSGLDIKQRLLELEQDCKS